VCLPLRIALLTLVCRRLIVMCFLSCLYTISLGEGQRGVGFTFILCKLVQCFNDRVLYVDVYRSYVDFLY
jgi:hypothetical protein